MGSCKLYLFHLPRKAREVSKTFNVRNNISTQNIKAAQFGVVIVNDRGSCFFLFFKCWCLLSKERTLVPLASLHWPLNALTFVRIYEDVVTTKATKKQRNNTTTGVIKQYLCSEIVLKCLIKCKELPEFNHLPCKQVLELEEQHRKQRTADRGLFFHHAL